MCGSADAVVGTLESAANLKHHNAWATPIIVIDEAGQATEPMALIPLMLARDSSHVVLIGDHMQLAPTVLSKSSLGGLECQPV